MAKVLQPCLSLFLLFAFSSIVAAYDPSPVRDFCVANGDSSGYSYALLCKDPEKVTIDDFIYEGINIPANTTNYLGSNVTLVNVNVLPGLNTLGISMGRVDFAPNGLNPPHLHNRASELFVVLEGILYAGFITNNPEHKLYAKILKKGDMITFPFGLIHFQLNIGSSPALGFAMLTSQNPGVQHVGAAIFGSEPPIFFQDVISKGFQLDNNAVDEAKRTFQAIKAAS